MAYDLFLAHASHDKAVAERLFDALAALHVIAFLDMRSIAPGERWDRVIPRAQRASRATLVLVSSSFDEAFYLGDEIATAIARHREAPATHTVIPVFLEGFPRDAFQIPYGLRVLNGLDVPALGGIDALALRLRAEVTAWRAAVAAPTPAAPPPTVAPRCEATALHRRLCALLDAQFETMVLYAGLDRSLIAAPIAPLSRRALDVVGLVQQGDATVCGRVCDAIAKVAPNLA